MNEYEKIIQAVNNYLESKDYDAAISLLNPLVEKEVAPALSLLGVMYQLGQGVELNGERSVKLLLRAVELGEGAAAHNLGTIYVTGLPGISADKEQSKKFYRLAKSMGAQFAPDEFYE